MIGLLASHAVAGEVVAGAEPPARPVWLSPGHARRLDPLARLAAGAVDGALAGLTLPPDTALAVGTAYGSVASTQRLLDGVAADGDALASPAAFSASVLSHVAGALGEVLGLHGPVATISQGGTSALAAVRWAWVQLAAGRASTALVIAADHHSPWTARVVGGLVASRWRISGGASAWVLRRDAGRELRLGLHPATTVVDGGAPDPRDEQHLSNIAAGRARCSAPALLGCWYPTAVTAVPLADGAIQLVECDRGRLVAVWCGPRN